MTNETQTQHGAGLPQMIRFELPDTGIIRAGQATEIGFKLASPFTIVDIALCEGFRVDLFVIGAKEFDAEACAKLKFAAINTLPTDGLRLRVTNTTEQDRQFEGAILLGPSTVIGWKGPAPIAASAAADPRIVTGDPIPQALAPRQNYAEPEPAAEATGYQALVDDQYARLYPSASAHRDVRQAQAPDLARVRSHANTHVAAPTPGSQSGERDVRAFQTPSIANGNTISAMAPRPQTPGHTMSRQGAATYTAEMREDAVSVTPGIGEIAVCLTRAQIMKILIMLNGQYVPPFQLNDTKAIFERAIEQR